MHFMEQKFKINLIIALDILSILISFLLKPSCVRAFYEIGLETGQALFARNNYQKGIGLQNC